MKRLAPLLLLFGVTTFIACGGDCPSGAVCEAAGITNYLVSNTSTVGLWVDFTVDGAALPDDLPILVEAGTRKQVMSDSAFGVNPRPTHTFRSLTLSVRTSTGTDLWQVYEQNPIDNAAWTGGRTDGTEDYGQSEYTLEVSRSDLDL